MDGTDQRRSKSFVDRLQENNNLLSKELAALIVQLEQIIRKENERRILYQMLTGDANPDIFRIIWRIYNLCWKAANVVFTYQDFRDQGNFLYKALEVSMLIKSHNGAYKRLAIGVVVAIVVDIVLALTITGLTYGSVISPEFFINYLAETAGIGAGSFVLSLLIGFFVAFGYNEYCARYKEEPNFTSQDLFRVLRNTIFKIQDQAKPQDPLEHQDTEPPQKQIQISVTAEEWENIEQIIMSAVQELKKRAPQPQGRV